MKIGNSLRSLEALRTGLAVSAYYPFFHAAPLPAAKHPLWAGDPQSILFDENKSIWRLFHLVRPHETSEKPLLSQWAQSVSFNGGAFWIPVGRYIFPKIENVEGFFGGCVVRDWHDSAGFGNGALLYFVTVQTAQEQKVLRFVAKGFTEQPVLDQVVFEQPLAQREAGQALRDFRVHWDGVQWVCVISLSDGVAFYVSQDTKTWEKSSVWRLPEGDIAGSVSLESPSFLPVTVQGDAADRKYLLCYGDPLAVAGKVYGVVGNWDGRIFEAVAPPQCLDYGCDMSMPNCTADPNSDRLWLQGWMGNWDYVQYMPFQGFFNAETLLREISVVKDQENYRLAVLPLAAQESVFPTEILLKNQVVTPENPFDFQQAMPGCAYKLSLSLGKTEASWPEEILFSLASSATGSEQGMVFKILPLNGKCEISREKGAMSFPKNIGPELLRAWETHHFLPIVEKEGIFTLEFFVDSFSVEAFCPESGAVATNVFFPKKGKQTLSLSCKDSSVNVSVTLKRA